MRLDLGQCGLEELRGRLSSPARSPELALRRANCNQIAGRTNHNDGSNSPDNQAGYILYPWYRSGHINARGSTDADLGLPLHNIDAGQLRRYPEPQREFDRRELHKLGAADRTHAEVLGNGVAARRRY